MLAFGLLAKPAAASMITTASWVPDVLSDGTAAGTLNGIGLTLSTIVISPNTPNIGYTYQATTWWNTGLGTSPWAPYSSGDAAVIGTKTSNSTQTIAFTSSITNPILLATFGDANTTLNFGSLPLTLLSSNNATLSGSVITFGAGASDSVNDGFAVMITGTFGPSTPLSFGYSVAPSAGVDSIAITLGEVPEPASLGLAFAGVFGLWIYRRRAVC